MWVSSDGLGTGLGEWAYGLLAMLSGQVDGGSIRKDRRYMEKPTKENVSTDFHGGLSCELYIPDDDHGRNQGWMALPWCCGKHWLISPHASKLLPLSVDRDSRTCTPWQDTLDVIRELCIEVQLGYIKMVRQGDRPV